MVKLQNLAAFYKNKKVFITGHTGFKGMWLCKILLHFGAEVTGYALDAPTEEGKKILQAIELEKEITSVYGDIRDYAKLKQAFDKAQPEIVIHLAAQPIVLKSYKDPVTTYSTNV